jgi:phage terminase Nu1 subunit (DNA packaging protein)
MTESTTNWTISRPEAVQLIGVSTRTFDRLEAEGVVQPVTRRHGSLGATYDAVDVVARYVACRESRIAASTEAPRDRRDASQADLNELRLQRERSEVLPREQVVDEGQAYVAAVTARLRALAPRLVQEGVVPAESKAAVSAMVEEAIDEMAGWTTRIALLEAQS